MVGVGSDRWGDGIGLHKDISDREAHYALLFCGCAHALERVGNLLHCSAGTGASTSAVRLVQFNDAEGCLSKPNRQGSAKFFSIFVAVAPRPTRNTLSPPANP